VVCAACAFPGIISQLASLGVNMSALGKVLLVLVFLASLGFLYVAARAMKTHHEFRTVYNQYVAAVAERDKLIREKKGDAYEENPSGNVPKGLLQVSRELEILLTNQGRLWLDCALAGRDNANPPTLTLQVPAPDPHGINDKSVLYVFEQQPQPSTYEDGIHSNNRPLVFLGEFKVTAINGAAVSLQPTRRLMASQAQAIANAQAPLAIYEQLPIDLHALWQGARKIHGDRLARFFDGALVDAAVIKEFQRDGEAAVAGQDPDERTLVEVKFLKNYADLAPAEQQELTALGFKIVNLRTPAGDDVKDAEGKVVSVDISQVIQKDSIAYFMQGLPDGKDGAAKVLVAKGIAQEERRIYVRQLHDYGLIFRQVLAELPVMENRIKDLNANLVAKGDEKTKLENDNTIQLALQKLLKDEKALLDAEVAVAQQVRGELTEDIAKIRAEIKKFEESNRLLVERLKKAQLDEADRINRESRARVSKEGN
jgi:hypothetical protein